MQEAKWTANIVNSEISPPGTLKINVQFINSTDATKNFNHVFETNQKQDEHWIDDQIREKLFHLNELPKLHRIVEKRKGEEFAHDGSRVGDPLGGLSPEAAEWKRNYDILNKYVGLNVLQIVESDRPAFVKQRQLVKETFKDEFIDLV